MDHLVRLDREARELERLCNGVKSMVVRGSMERRPPHGAVGEGDRLYFVQEGEEGTVRATARVRKADSTPMLDQEASIIRIVQNQRKLMLTEQQFARWGGLRFLVFVEAEEVERVEPFLVDPSLIGQDGWAVLNDISLARRRGSAAAFHAPDAQARA
ncbi:hypothetical protein AOA80_08035 [Methanomassiliicoccales archaeon RumEn M1]|jgi:hypothetical protein|nr:hypothetical protein AOA80_08035 [Methanomassiliicoccales archaeon RumEn M1]